MWVKNISSGTKISHFRPFQTYGMNLPATFPVEPAFTIAVVVKISFSKRNISIRRNPPEIIITPERLKFYLSIQ